MGFIPAMLDARDNDGSTSQKKAHGIHVWGPYWGPKGCHDQPDARYGREDCAYISGANGRWGDYGCNLAEMRCLCESGGAMPSAAYVEFSSRHEKDTRRVATRQRLWATLVVALLTAITLPLTTAIKAGQSTSARAPRWGGLHAPMAPKSTIGGDPAKKHVKSLLAAQVWRLPINY